MPPRRRQPARRASLRSHRISPTPEPAIETIDMNNSGEDMDMSEEEAGGFTSDMVGGPKSDTTASENEQDDEIDVEDNQQEELVEEDEEEQQDELSSSSSPIPPPKPTKARSSPAKPKLKIKLKFSGVARSNATPTPSDEMPLKPGRKGHPRHVEAESEEEDEEDSNSSPSTTYAGPTRMTQRQAALAGMVESSEHLMLEETVSKRKKHLNETELALKREETARKRKNLTAKKLEDEKIETINRLLKKQTRTRGKKGAVLAADADEDGEQEGEETSVPAAPPPPPPTLFRWVSSSKPDSPALSFSIPPSLVSEVRGLQSVQVANPPPPKLTPTCDVSGCQLPRKYKLVKDPSRGGCGMEHLKVLQVS